MREKHRRLNDQLGMVPPNTFDVCVIFFVVVACVKAIAPEAPNSAHQYLYSHSHYKIYLKNEMLKSFSESELFHKILYIQNI